MNKITTEFEKWLSHKEIDEQLYIELNSLKKNTINGDEKVKEAALEEINDRFYKDLEFGTGGLRGVLGAGTNRMNIYTVRKATQGVARYLNAHYENPSAAIGYDSRINSELFAETATDVLRANGIDVFLYDTLMPAPALSFATRYHGCSIGIMITASHNPSKYNGYKVYNDEGCQVTEIAAEEILNYINETDIFSETTYQGSAKLIYMKEETKKAFYDAVEAEKMIWDSEDVMQQDLARLSVVYTPLNGTGNLPVREIMRRIGVQKVMVVKEQELPDGMFPSCPYPNPEKREALERGLALCNEVKPDLLLATDPDCDRIGVAVCEGEEQHLLTGNETGILLFDFICMMRKQAKEKMIMPQNPVAVRTVVSSQMPDAIAAEYGVFMETTLTGFKYIGETIGKLEQQGRQNDYIFGFEESYGYLSGTHVRDKDAVNAAMLVCQMAAWYKKHGRTLSDRLNELYERHGYYINHLLDFTFEGEKGMNQMAEIMRSFRDNPPKEMIGKKVTQFMDYEIAVRLPKADVLEFMLEDGSGFIVRPSGTEPKLKVYLSARAATRNEAETVIRALTNEISKRV